MSIKKLSACFAIIAFAGNVLAASNLPILKEVSGNLMVNNASRYISGVNGMVLKSNDKVIVPSSAGGKIVREECTYILKPNTIVTVSDTGCNFLAAPYVATEASATKAVESNTTTYTLLGVAGIIGVAAAASSGGGSNKNNDISPQ